MSLHYKSSYLVCLFDYRAVGTVVSFRAAARLWLVELKPIIRSVFYSTKLYIYEDQKLPSKGSQLQAFGNAKQLEFDTSDSRLAVEI